MPLLVLMFPIIAITALVVIILAIIAAFSKAPVKFSMGSVVLAAAHFLALMAVALGVVQVGFSGVEKWIPDALTDDTWRVRESVEYARYALALLIIVTPIYLIMMWKGAEAAFKEVSWSKKFMSVTVLLVAGLVVIGTLITLVYNFLAGELGMRAFAKMLYLLVIAGGIGGYYQIFVRKGITEKVMRSASTTFAAVSVVVIVALIVIGFLVTGGPAGARAERFDDRRLTDLSSIQWQVDTYFQEYGRLPQGLTELHDASRGFALPVDPRTEEPYGYNAIVENTETLADGTTRRVATFEICAEFETVRDISDNSGSYPTRDVMSKDASFLPGYYEYDESPFWNHPIGEYCFERTIKENKQPEVMF